MSVEKMITSAPKSIDEDFEGYSEEFREKVRRFGMRKLLDGSHFGGDFRAWETQRRDGAALISKPGTILDYGCANGFLLACYKEWSDVDLEAFGIDTDHGAIGAARELFGDSEKNHFFAADESLERIPGRLDYAFWNVWDNAEFDEVKNKDILDHLLARTKGGRTILGFYHPDPAVNGRKLAWLSEHGYPVSEVKRSGNGHIFAAIDVSEDDNGAHSF